MILTKKKKLFSVIALLSGLLLLFAGCSHDSGGDSTEDKTQTDSKTDDGKTDETTDGKTDDGKTDGKTDDGTSKTPSVVSDQYWWGTWQRMSDGRLFVISEDSIKEYDEEGMSYTNHAISSTSTADVLYTSTLGSFSKTSARIMEKDSIPYLRQGGTGLEFSLKLVGFESTVSASVSARAGTSPRSNISAKVTTPNHTSYSEDVTSDSEGIITAHAPVAGDEMTITLAKPSGKTIVVPGVKVETNGSNMGTVPIADDGQYILKITGTVADEDKTDGYLYANNYATYPLTLTITNISDVDCPSTFYRIEAADSCLTVSGSGSSALSGTIPTMVKGATKTVNLTVECGSITDAYIDTGLNITITNSTGTWVDYVPLRFFKGLVPISFAAISDGDNSIAALNGFVIYPDNNTKFFAVDQTSATTVFLPSFGNANDYLLVFCGATTSQTLSESTEMFYTVALGTAAAKTVKLPDDETEHQKFVNYGESNGGNETEGSTYPVAEDFEAYLSGGDKDFYSLQFSDTSIIDASAVPKEYWGSSAANVEALTDETIASNGYGVVFGTLANSDSWVVHKFYASSSGTYTIEWGDRGNKITGTSDSTSYSYDGSARLYVTASTYASFSSTIFNSETTSSQTITVSSAGYVYIRLKSWVSIDGGTYALRVRDSSGTAKTLYYSSGSGYAGYDWTIGRLSTTADTNIYYFYAYKDTDYTLRWSDAGNGFGHSADIKVSASTDVSKFTQSDSEILFFEKDSGFTNGQTFSVSTNGYVFFKIQAQSSIAKYEGSYALCLIDEETYLQDIGEYTEESFVVASGDEISNENAWKWGCLYADGYEIFKFPVEGDKIYTITWDDITDGSDSSSYTGDILVSAYATYEESTKNLSDAYWESVDSGYSTANTVAPATNGFVFVKLVPKDNDSTGTFRIALSYGPNMSKTWSMVDVASHNCNFYAYDIGTNDDAVWTTGTFSSSSDEDIYYFTRDENAGDKVYKLYTDTGYSGTNTYTAWYVSLDITDSPSSVDPDDTTIPGYTAAVSIFRTKPGTEYIHVLPGTDVSSGTYAITMIDGDNNPVTLTKLTATTGENITEGWLTGEMTSGNDRIVYRYKAKANTFFRMFWDDASDGSGSYTADIEVAVGASDEDTTNSKILNNGYTNGGWCDTYTEDTVLYFYVTVKDNSADNIGSYAITIVEGNEASSDFTLVSPNTTVTIASKTDISVLSSVDETSRVFTADTGYDSYTWYVDGKKQSETTNVFTADVSTWKSGTYEIELEAKKGTQYFSSTIFLKVE